MPSNRKITDLTFYKSVLPYDSELFGVYQPLLGWKSKQIGDRIEKSLNKDKKQVLEKIRYEFLPMVEIRKTENSPLEIQIKPGMSNATKLRNYDSVLLKQIAAKLPEYNRSFDNNLWKSLINDDNINSLLKKTVTKSYTDAYQKITKTVDSPGRNNLLLRRSKGENEDAQINPDAFERQLQYESSIAGALLHLVKEKSYDSLKEIFYNSNNNADQLGKMMKILSAQDPQSAYLNIENLDPRDLDHINSAALSPISVVHLFRQYFYELDSFLGTPVSHVWLSPGSSVELIEIHTRKYTIEKSIESVLDIFNKSEQSTTTHDEISEAVKDDNEQDIKFGASVKASYASVEATSSFDYNNTQKTAREKTHKVMREQTEKLSSEIRKNYKTTFKTNSEFTDVSNIKHTLANTTNDLINYELRRKMRQVGVQVQDIGTYLCWQTFVDDAGSELGLSKLIHIAKPPELDGIPHPESIPPLAPFAEEKIITIPFISTENGADNEDEVYLDGVEASNEEFMGDVEKIRCDFSQEFLCPKSNYTLENVEYDSQGLPFSLSTSTPITNKDNKATFTLHLESADFQGKNSVQIRLILYWYPTEAANKLINDQNELIIKNFKEREKTEYEKAFVENAKDRINKSSRVVTRNSEELREEERIVVYRKLIQDMLLKDVPMPDDNTRHVVSELLNSIFDVDKMLYFVAPEWWRPRLHRSRQQLNEAPKFTVDKTNFATADINAVMYRGLKKNITKADKVDKAGALNSSTIGWGGINDSERDNYYITDESEPARFGSSLGWLLQLDGDNMRNAFLNAPWVKAVIPIRPGKEEAAINWLKGVEGMNGITDDVIYHTINPQEKDINGAPLDGQKMIDVIHDLAKKIKKKYEEGLKSGVYPKASEVSDPALVDADSVVTATPIDRVYEHGFYPLKGSFRANVDGNYEIFDQWIEVLPTDQIVPVPVKYDPITGRQI
ncbi:MAG: hypothetical protein SGI89_00400 [bacterium]|nr:hypothetical protein [bacterium]